jgi:dTDP-4-dehydrorhamnose 3,5-epimerase
MPIYRTDLPGVFIVEPQKYEDNRGWFMETFSKRDLEKEGFSKEFVQDNHSFSIQKGVLRGLHFQNNPKAQAKLVRCTKGIILDVAVDLRKDSATFCKWISVELSSENIKQLLIPKGFAHGFVTLSDEVEVLYKVDEYYSPEHDRSIRFDDPQIAVNWGIKTPILSQKDLSAPLLKDSDCNF